MENTEKKLKFENAFETPVVIDWDYYVKYYTLPTTANQEQYLNQEELIKKWIIQATDDINGLCNGRVYAEWDLLDETSIIDEQRASYLQKAIGKWVEFIICTGHIWANREDVVQGNIPISIRTESKNNEIEFQRKDIIKLLKIGHWYQEVFLDGVSAASCENTSFSYDDLIKYLNNLYLRTDGKNWPYANLDFAGWGINNVGNITAAVPTTVGANSVIDGFILRNCIYEIDPDNIRFATYDRVGVVKIDYKTMRVDTDGLISANLPDIKPATYAELGVVKIDEVTMNVDADGLLSSKSVPIETDVNLYYENGILGLRDTLSNMYWLRSSKDNFILENDYGQIDLKSKSLITLQPISGKLEDVVIGNPFGTNWNLNPIRYVTVQNVGGNDNFIEHANGNTNVAVGGNNRIYGSSAESVIMLGSSNESSGLSHTVVGRLNDTNPGSTHNIIVGQQSVIQNDASYNVIVGDGKKISEDVSGTVVLGGKELKQFGISNALIACDKIVAVNGIIDFKALRMTSTVATSARTFPQNVAVEFRPEIGKYQHTVVLNFLNAGRYEFDIIMNGVIISSNVINIGSNEKARVPIIFQVGIIGSIINRGSQPFTCNVAEIKSFIGSIN